MRRHKSGGSYFWGLLLIIIGLTYLLRYLFNFYFPLGTIILAFILIYGGISIITKEPNINVSINNTKDHRKENIMFSDSHIDVNNEQSKYNIMFSNSTIDLRNLPFPSEKKSINIDVLFSKSLIRINPNIPAIIRIDSAFSSARFPNNTQITFGDYSITTPGYKEGMPHYFIKGSVVFGSIDIIE